MKRTKKLAKLEDSVNENNTSDEDMFNDREVDDNGILDTPPNKPAKSWKDDSRVKNSNVNRPGEYKSVNQSKNTRAKKR